MKSTKNKKNLVFTISLLALSMTLGAQTYFKQTSDSYITIAGKSTLHDWTMTSLQAVISTTFQVDEKGIPNQLKSLTVSVPSESLKSAHKAMDKNAYSALKVDKYKTIGFALSSAVTQNDLFQCVGNLSIAGVTKSISIEATCKQKDKSIRCTGSKAIKMSDFQVEAPSFMFGTVKTGDEITISFNIELAAGKN